MSYFLLTDSEAEEKISKLAERIKLEIFNSMKDHVTSILLIGALARGEGAWKRIDGQLKILSDIDIRIVAKPWVNIPAKLMCTMENISQETGIRVELGLIHPWLVRFSKRNNTWTYDVKTTAKILYGSDILSQLPRVEPRAIDFENAVELFFHKQMGILYACKPEDFSSPNQTALESLSLSATGIIFTCTDIITIHHGVYDASVIERVNIVKEWCNKKAIQFPVDIQVFLHDLDVAVQFKFEQTAKPFLDDAASLWVRAKESLIRIFEFYFEQHYGENDMLSYHRFIGKRDIRKRLYFLANNLIIYARLVKMGRLPHFRCLIHGCVDYYRLAAFMTATALNEELDTKYILAANDVMSKIYRDWSHDTRTGDKDIWMAIREELKEVFWNLHVA